MHNLILVNWIWNVLIFKFEDSTKIKRLVPFWVKVWRWLLDHLVLIWWHLIILKLHLSTILIVISLKWLIIALSIWLLLSSMILIIWSASIILVLSLQIVLIILIISLIRSIILILLIIAMILIIIRVHFQKQKKTTKLENKMNLMQNIWNTFCLTFDINLIFFKLNYKN